MMNNSAPNFNEPNQSGTPGTLNPVLNELDVLINDISDEALESSSGVENRPMFLLPCTAAPCLASTFCQNKC